MRPPRRWLLVAALALLAVLVARGWPRPPAVGVVEIRGTLTDPEPTLELLERCEREDRIRAVVLRLDTPGGSVSAAQELHAMVRRLDARKPVVASLGALATSAGYYVACAARRIVADPGTITGSIGAVIYGLNVQGLCRRLGIQPVVIKRGKHKDLLSPFRPLSEQERRMLEEVLEDIRQQFLEAILRRRPIERKELERIADGRVLSGRQALRLKLVDRLGGLREAVELAGRLAGLRERPPVVRYRPRRGLLAFLLEEGSHLGMRLVAR